MNPNIFSVLAEPNRLHIVELLRGGSHSVNDIVNRLQLQQPQVSKHLRFLKESGLVEIHPVAQQRFYKLRLQPLKELDNWLEKYRILWEERIDRLDEMLQKEKQSERR